MSSKFFTNQGGNSLLKKFEGVFENIESIRHFDALVGYFRASGYFKIRPFLDKIPKIRILNPQNSNNPKVYLYINRVESNLVLTD